jgi:hypothetical protein
MKVKTQTGDNFLPKILSMSLAGFGTGTRMFFFFLL